MSDEQTLSRRRALQILGTVTNAAHPVANALVIALNTKDLAATQVWTAGDGSFTLPALRNGVYKIIAVKSGFAPLITTLIPTKPSHRLGDEAATMRAASDCARAAFRRCTKSSTCGRS